MSSLRAVEDSFRRSIGVVSLDLLLGRVRLAALLILLGALGSPCAQASIPTSTTTLAITPSSPVAAGTVVTLTATVTNPAPVTTGLVSFCDATATFCDNSALIGTAQLTSAGTAVIKIVQGIGSHSYKAVFKGTTAVLSSSSSAQALTVTGPFTTATNISAAGSAGNYTLTGRVVGTGSAFLSPTGSISFLDTSNASYVLGSSVLGAATLAQTFATQVPYTTSAGPHYVAVGDFNGDGKLDLAIADFTANKLSVLLGNGDGTFQAQVIYSAGTGPTSVAVGDFNGDGKLDLAVTNSGDNSAATTVRLKIHTAKIAAGNAAAKTSAVFAMLLLPLMGLVSLRRGRRQIPHMFAVVLLAVLTLGAMVGLTSCAGSTTPPVTTDYTVVLTATSGTLSHSTNLVVAVKQ